MSCQVGAGRSLSGLLRRDIIDDNVIVQLVWGTTVLVASYVV